MKFRAKTKDIYLTFDTSKIRRPRTKPRVRLFYNQKNQEKDTSKSIGIEIKKKQVGV